jgi:hypothetical protein
MAKLNPVSYPMPSPNLPVDEYIEKSKEALNSIPADRLYQEPYADGYAYYKVISFRPLVLQHVPYLDAWNLPAHTIRGLRVKDVKTNIEMRLSFEKMMKG